MGSLLKQFHIHLRNFNTWGKQDDRFMKNVSTDIAQAVRSKQVSAVEVTQADLEKIESVNLENIEYAYFDEEYQLSLNTISQIEGIITSIPSHFHYLFINHELNGKIDANLRLNKKKHFMKILRKGKHGIPIRDPKVAAKQLSDVQRERGWRVLDLFLTYRFSEKRGRGGCIFT